MSDLVPGTMVRMRTTRRFGHYNVGELIAVSLGQGRELHAKQLAEPVDMLVPTQPASPAPPDAATGGATRTPAQVVRK